MSVQHAAITEAFLHEPKGVSTATAGQKYIANGAGSGSWTTDVVSAADTVHINSLSDFPAPSGGAITLVASTNYVIGADITTADRFITADNNSITANNINGSSITYTGTGDMITGVDVNFDIHDITLVAATSSQVFNFSETGGGNTKIFTMRTVGVTSCPKYATFDNLLSVDIVDSNSVDADDGITVVGGGWLNFSLNKFALISTSATFVGIDFGTSIHQNVEMINLIMVGPSGAEGISGLAASGNIAANNLANVAASSFLGAITPLATIAVDDIRWEFDGNAGVSNSTKAADAYLSTLQLVTIGGSSTFTAIGGSSFLTDTAARFTTDSAGVLTYISEIDSCFIVTVTATLDKVAGGADVLAMRVAKNGTAQAKSQSQTQSADPTSVVSQVLLSLTKDDTVEAMVANNTTAGNINVNDMNISIHLSG